MREIVVTRELTEGAASTAWTRSETCNNVDEIAMVDSSRRAAGSTTSPSTELSHARGTG